MSTSNTRYLVETDWLENHLGDPDIRILDCSYLLTPYGDECRIW